MKTKFKRGSLRTLSIVLSLVILLTSIGIASLITANAYTSLTFYYKIGTGSWTSTSVNLSSNSGSVDIALTSGTTMYSVIKTDNNEWYGNQSLEAGATRNLATLSSNYDYTSGSNNNTFTPSASGTYTFTLDMGSKKISVSGSSGGGGDEPAASSYSIAGRFKVHDSSGSDVYTSSTDSTKWSNNSTAIKFVETEDTGVYVLHTYSTLSELSADISSNKAYFFIYDSSNTKWYQPWSGNSGSVNTVSAAYSTKYSMNQETSFHDNVGNFFVFSGSNTTKYVDIYFDTTDGYKLYYKLVDPTYSYYMEGRLNFAWKQTSTDYPFEATGTDNLFVYHTNLTVAELASSYNDNGNQTRHFFLGRKKEGSTEFKYIHTSGSGDNNVEVSSPYSTTYSAQINDNYNDNNFWHFTGSDSTHYVDIYYDAANNNIYYKLVDVPFNYYIEGRFKVRDYEGTETSIGEGGWATTSKSIPFSATTTEGLYVLKTYSTISELEADVGSSGDKVPYFYIGEALGDRNPSVYYHPTTNGNYSISASNAGTSIATNTTNTSKNFYFHKSSSWTETGQYVVLYLDTSGENPQLYFEFEDPSYNYYLEGRMEVYDSSERDDDAKTSIDWEHDSKDLKFVSTSTSGLYKLETYKTVAELTGHNYYFVLGRGTRSNAPTTFFRPYSDKTLKASDANKKFEGQWTGSWTNFAGYHYIFNDSSSTNSDALVTFYYNENSDQFYFMLTEQKYDTTIYVVDNSEWSALDIYTWLKDGAAANKTFGDWPGKAITNGASSYGNYNVTKSGSVYTVKFNRKSADCLIFNNGNSGDVNQTADLTLTNGKTYVINSDKTVTEFDGQVVNFIAKDGMIRDDSHKSFGEYATTTVTAVANQVIVNGTETAFSNTKFVTGTAVKGKEITVTTTINDTYKSKYYVAGFSFNGDTPQELEENSTGVYSCTYTIPEDFASDTLEITPIYFLKSAYSANYVTFNISGYDNVKNEGWGSTLFIYPFYTNYTNAINYGTYPGQPVINYGGRLYTQIPTTTNGEASGDTIKGVTISNGYWDLKHRDVEGWPNDSAYHHQTYDFDDFYKLYKENGSNLNSIFFTFKYEDAQAHRTTVPTSHDSTNASDYRHDDIADTLTQAELDAYGAANGFEDYINSNGKLIDLFGTVLTGSSLTADPIYVISQGYEYNNSGSFATEWDVFYWDSANSRYQKVVESGGNSFTSIVPSILHIKDYEHISTNYPAADGDLAVSDYEGIYRALEAYAERPVKICYEKDIMAGHFNRNKNNESGYDQAYRCDGVWSYTLKTDFVAANTLIEYSDDNGASWYVDAFNGSTAAGTNTKCKAYFTYLSDAKNGYTSAYDGTTAISNVYVDDSKYFTFKAESAGQYEFIGWTLRDAAGNESAITYDSENAAETKMSSTVTLVARFKKVSSGSLIVSHTLDSGSEGLGTTYLGIKILDSSDALITTIADEATNTTAKTIGKAYITSDSNNKIQITLKTVVTGENTFNKFQLSKDGAENIDADSTYLPSGVTPAATTTKTITFPISSLFTGTDQNLTSLAYYSLLNETLNKYDVTFTYQDRNNASKSMRVKGTFTKGQLKNYVTGTGTSKTVAANFFSEIKPDVSNFKTDITFDFNTVTPTWAGPTDNAYTMTATVNSTLSNTLDRTVTFVTPFAMTNYVANDDEGVYSYLSDQMEYGPLTVEYGKLIKLSNGSVDLENGSFVTAPATLVETVNGEEVVHYFKCWTIKTLSGATVASCYYPEFNYLTYDNSIIEAEYSTDNTKYYEYFNTAQAATATFLKNTRTQWNVGSQGDLVYSDFALSFKYKDVKFYEDGWSDKYSAGVIMQRLDEVDLDSEGYHAKTLAQYASKYAGTLAADQTNIENYIKNNTAVSGISTRKTEFNYTKFDNKNRLEYFVGMYNSKSWNEAEQAWEYSQWDKDESEWTTADGLNTNSKYVYRLFTYVYDKGKGTVVLSAPAYFYLYNTVNQ